MEFKPEKIRALRQKHHHSLGTLARLMEARFGYRISRATISLWERGKARPKIDALAVLCTLYRVEAGYFFEEPISQQFV